jgi:DNA-binding MarR family transcriptional regulator
MEATLEERGLVRREADPADRRIAYVSLTPEGKRTVQLTRTRKTAFLAKRLRRLSEREVADLRVALPLLEALLEDKR